MGEAATGGAEATGGVLVLGASGGIGSALCARLARDGVPVLGVARDPERLEALAKRTGVATQAMDARDPEALAAVVADARARFGTLRGAASCVGSLLLKPAHLTTPEEWADIVATNLTSAFLLLRAVTPVLRRSGGSIVFCSSAAAAVGLPNHEAIAAAKAGIEGLVRSAAASYGSQGVRVNAVAPGLVRTPLTARLLASPAGEAASVAMHALGRLGEPDDVARVLAWLLGTDGAWVTGQVFGVDGGLARVRPRAKA